jgi:Na+-translocating ferredoxin:NAD+ oxidoreductase RnfG subunit
MSKLIWIILIGVNFIKAGDIQSDVEDIISSEFISTYAISLHKYELPDDLKSQTEKQVQQKFFKDYVYLWKICQGDSIAGYAILDNTYGKSLPITFLVIFSPTGEIRKVEIIRYREPYGGAVGSRRWLDQFIGKSSENDFKVDRDIDTISGATISVNSVTRAVQKLALIVNQLITKENFKCNQEHHTVGSKAK